MKNQIMSAKELKHLAEQLVESNFTMSTDVSADDRASERELLELWEALGDLPTPDLSDERKPSRDVDPNLLVPGSGKQSMWRLPAWERWAACFVLFALAIGALMTMQPWRTDTGGRHETFVAERAEIRDIRLTDGTQLKLSPQTVVEVTLGNNERRLRLIRGEALFTVAPDATRPFIVGVGDSEVRAIGTVFNIRTVRAETEVTVVEGRIAVTIANEQRSRPTRQLVSAGERIRYGRPVGSNVAVTSSIIEAAQPANISTATDWTRNELSFDGERLADVIAEMNRYGRDDITLLEPALADIPVYGILHGGDVDGLMGIIADIAAEHGSARTPAARVERAAG